MPLSRRQRANKTLQILRMRRDAAARRGDNETENRHIETLRKMAVIRDHSEHQAEVPVNENALKAVPKKVNKV